MRKSNFLKVVSLVLLTYIMTFSYSEFIYWKYDYNSTKANALSLFVMWLPILAYFANKILWREKLHIGLKSDINFFEAKKNSLFVILTIILMSIGLVLIGNVIMIATYPDSFEVKDYNAKLIIANIMNTIGCSIVYSFLFAIGEEIVFRAILVDKLGESINKVLAIIISGFLWGLLYIPILRRGFIFGKNYDHSTTLGIIVFIIAAIFISTWFYYVYEKTGNVVITALAHGFFYCSFMQLRDIFMGMNYNVKMINQVLIYLVVYSIPGLVILVKMILAYVLKKENK